MSLWY